METVKTPKLQFKWDKSCAWLEKSDKEEIKKLFKQERAEYIADKKVRELAQQKFYNKELQLKEMYEFPITEQGKNLHNIFKSEALA